MRNLLIGISLITSMLMAGTPVQKKRENDPFMSQMAAMVQSGSEQCRLSPLKYTYKYVDKPVGSIVTVGKTKYMIVKYPFVELGSGKKYYIKMPVEMDEHDNPVGRHVTVNYVTKDASCFHHRFSGYPSFNQRIIYQVSENILGREEGAIDHFVGFWTQVLINKTALTIAMAVGSYKTKRFTFVDGDYTDDAPWKSMKRRNVYVKNLKTLLNYIKIGEVNP